MKIIGEPYELSKTELEIINEVSRAEGSISDLARRTNKSPPSIMRSVNKLAEKGFVHEEQTGRNKKIVRLSERKHAQLLRELFLKYPHIPWADILSYSGIIPLLKLEHGMSSASRFTSWRAMRNLTSRGIVQREDGRFTINPKFQLAEQFINEYQKYTNEKKARLANSRAVIVWSRGPDFIIQVPSAEKVQDSDFKATGTSKLAEYGIPLISNVRFYFYSPHAEELGPEETIVHMLLTDGITNLTYALILLAKGPIDREKLQLVASEYGLLYQVRALIDFLDRRRAPDLSLPLPTWKEFAEKAADYGIIMK